MITQVVNKETNGRSAAKNTKADKRQLIIEAARTLFTTQGYENTTIAEVAKSAGVAVGTVYLYFKNKVELLEGVRGSWDLLFVERMVQPEIQALPPHLRVRPLMRAAFKLCEDFAEMVQLMGLQPQQIGDKHDEAGAIPQAVALLFEEGIAAGTFRPIDIKTAAPIAVGMVETALHYCFDLNGGKDQQRFIDTLVDVFAHWILKPEVLAQREDWW